MSDIVVCGESLVDRVPKADPAGASGPMAAGHVARPGGSPANVAVGLGRLGESVALLTRLSTDHFGLMLRRHLTDSGVDLTLARTTPEPTSVATVDLDTAGSVHYTFELDGHADDGWRPQDLPAELPAGAALHVSGALALARPALRATVDGLLIREQGRRLVSFDPNPRPLLGVDRRALAAWVARADLVKVSSEDLAWAFPDEPLREVARRWLATGPSLVVVTLGAAGVLAVGPAGELELPGHPVPVVDTVGAGDAFSAGLLAALRASGRLSRPGLRAIDAADLRAALEFAQLVAATTCTRPGADPPWRGADGRLVHSGPTPGEDEGARA